MDREIRNPRRRPARVPLLIGAVLGLWLLLFLVGYHGPRRLTPRGATDRPCTRNCAHRRHFRNPARQSAGLHYVQASVHSGSLTRIRARPFHPRHARGRVEEKGLAHTHATV
jgi:hypothetical protein